MNDLYRISIPLLLLTLFTTQIVAAPVQCGQSRNEDWLIPAAECIFSDPEFGVATNTANFAAFGFMFFLFFWVTTQTFGKFYAENLWINSGVAFFGTIVFWERFGPAFIKIATTLGWIVWVVILFFFMGDLAAARRQKYQSRTE